MTRRQITGNTGKRAQNRADVHTSLLITAREHLAERGAAALSLRAIARDMGMAPSALFRYVANRDDLLTLLITTAYTELADHVEAQESKVRREDLSGRWSALAHGMRSWSVEHPHDFALLYGSPVPEYSAPGEITNDPGTRVLRLVAAIIRDTDHNAGPPPSTDPALETHARAGVEELMLDPDLTDLDPTHVVRGITAWNLLIGAISSEVFGHLGPEVGEREDLFECTVILSAHVLFGPHPPDGSSPATRASSRP